MALKLAGLGCGVALLLLQPVRPAAAQEAPVQVLGAALEVTVEDTRARVRLVYQLTAASTQVELKGIRFEGMELEDGRSGAGAAPFEIVHDEHGYTARVPLTSGDEELLRLQYWVDLDRSASEIEVVVPVLVPNGTATEARRDFFEGTLELPDGYRLVESFPSHTERVEGSTSYTLMLPVVPGLVRARAVSGSAGWGFIALVEAAALSLVALLTWLGWRHLQREV